MNQKILGHLVFWYLICNGIIVKKDNNLRPTVPLLILSVISVILFCSFTFNGTEFKKKKRTLVCTEYTDKYVDKITGIKRYIAREKISIDDFENKNSFDLVWFKNKQDYTLAVKSIDKMCFENDIAVSFHMLQGKVVTCASSHISNCESLMTIHFSKDEEQDKKVEMLVESEVLGISFDIGSDVYKLKLRRNQSQTFQETLKCLKLRN